MDRYTPHPVHQLIPVILILIAAVVAGLFPTITTVLAFIAVLIIAVATGLWIAWAGNTREQTEYWQQVGWDIHDLKKSDPAIWGALGFREPPPNVVKIEKDVTQEAEVSPDSYAQDNFFIEGVDTWKIQKFADGILTGVHTFAETNWTGLIAQSDIRSIKEQMFGAGLLEYINPLNSRSGFVLNVYGYKFLRGMASPTITVSRELKVVQPSPRKSSTPPTPHRQLTPPKTYE